MKTKTSLKNKLATKVNLSTVIVAAGIFSIVLAAILFTISNFGIQKQSEAAVFPSGTYRIGGSGSSPSAGCSYVNIKSALTAMSGKSLNGPVTFILTSSYTGSGETYPITFNAVTGASSTNVITIRPDINTNINISASSSTSVLKFNSASYFTIDGYAINDSSTRRITIINNKNSAKTAAVWISSLGAGNGCTGVTIKNCNIAAYKWNDPTKSSFGIIAGGSSIDYGFTSTISGDGNNALSIINNNIYRAGIGIKVTGTLSNNANNLLIKDNIIGSNTATDYIGIKGIELDNVNNTSIIENNIFNINQSTISSSILMPTGIWLGNINNSVINKNTILNINNTGSGAYGGTGIEFYNWGICENILISNNVIAGMGGLGYSNYFYSNIGIKFWYGSAGAQINNVRIYYNSVNLSYGSCSGSSMSAAISLDDDLTNVDMRNNVFANTTNCTNRYSVYNYAVTVPFSNINYNNYYTTGKVGYDYSTGTAETLDEWRAITDGDLRSISADPSFTSNTDLTPNLSSPNAWFLHGNGCQIAEINSDIIGRSRSTAIAQGATDIGAYEFNHALLPDPPTVTNTTTISDGSTTSFNVGDMNVASIKWHGASLPTNVTLKYYSGANPPDLPVDAKYVNAYWEITPSGGTGFTYDITLKYDDAIFGNISDESQMFITKKHGTGSWEDFDNCSIDIQSKTITLYGLSTFSLFTIRGGSGSHLPISLISFTGKLAEKDVELKWKTATEINNDYFTIERSTDCKIFESIAKINGAGNSNMVLKYDYDDVNVAEVTKATKVYYRLKQTDFDGKFTYSGIIGVSLNEESSSPFELLSANPNPFQNDLFVSVSSIVDGTAIIKLFDMNGKQVKEQQIEIQEGINTLTLNNNADLKKGTYLLNIEMNKQKSKVIKVIKY